MKAVEKAASMAGLVEYEVVDLSGGAIAAMQSMRSVLNGTQPAWSTLDLQALNMLNPPPAIYYLYLPPEKLEMDIVQKPAGNIIGNITIIGRGGENVLIDMSHGNRVTGLELEILLWELVKRNMTVKFISDWKELRGRLQNSTALIIALPMMSYSREEVEDVRRFVKDGGILVLLHDPATECSRSPDSIRVMNSIANTFGIYFASSYLYNEGQHYGIYRNIYVAEFADSSITRGIKSLLLFTVTYIRSDDHGVAWPPESNLEDIRS